MLRKEIHYFAIGIVVSTYVVYRLINLIMAWESGSVDDTSSFFTFHNVVFCLHMWVLFLCGWIFKGSHNRRLLLLWAIGHVINLAVYYELMEIFLVQWRNIYALNFVSTIAILALYTLIVERRRCQEYLYKKTDNSWFYQPGSTKFEVYLREFIGLFVLFEVVFALAMSVYGLAHQLRPGDSFYDTMQFHQHPDFFEWYFNILTFFTLYLTVMLLRQAQMDRQQPDNATVHLSVDEKLILIKRMNKRF